jgi:glycosyl transferase family 25
MPISLINLDRSPDRLAAFHARNPHLGDVTRFRAVDGRELVRPRLVEQGLLRGEPNYTPGALGVFLSHVELWRTATKTKQAVTIAEDDAIFSRHFDRSSRALTEAAGPDWDLILWGWNFDVFLWIDLIPGVSPAVIRTFQERLREGVDAFQSQDLSPRLFRLLHFFGMVCYSVSPKGAGSLLDFCLPLRPMLIPFRGFDVTVENRGVDHLLNAVVPDLKAFVSIPPLVVTENRHETSTVA